MKPRILIVDDEERMATVVAMALGRAGYECETCASGEAALAALDARGADVVVTDWKHARHGRPRAAAPPARASVPRCR